MSDQNEKRVLQMDMLNRDIAHAQGAIEAAQIAMSAVQHGDDVPQVLTEHAAVTAVDLSRASRVPGSHVREIRLDSRLESLQTYRSLLRKGGTFG